jgi:hypothetical protein
LEAAEWAWQRNPKLTVPERTMIQNYAWLKDAFGKTVAFHKKNQNDCLCEQQ